MSASEVLTLTSVNESYVTTATVLGRTALPIFAGSREAKSMLDVQFEGATEPTSLFERPLHPNSVEIWEDFHASNITTTPDIFVGTHGKLVTPNLKTDGSEVYGKYLATILLDCREREPSRPQIDELFVGLLNTRERQVTDRIAERVKAAATARLQLPFDDPLELIAHPDGSWDLITLDLTNALKISERDASSLEVINSSSVLSFQANLDRIYKSLVAQGVRGRSPTRSRWWSLPSKRT